MGAKCAAYICAEPTPSSRDARPRKLNENGGIALLCGFCRLLAPGASTLYARTDAPLFVYSRPGGPPRSNFLAASAGGAEAAICCCRLSSAPALQRHDAQQSGLSREQG